MSDYNLWMMALKYGAAIIDKICCRLSPDDVLQMSIVMTMMIILVLSFWYKSCDDCVSYEDGCWNNMDGDGDGDMVDEGRCTPDREEKGSDDEKGSDHEERIILK